MTRRDSIAYLRELERRPLPDLGDENKSYPVRLTEREINAIYAAAAFTQSSCEAMVAQHFPYYARYWNHYGPTLTSLSDRLSQFDDGNAPANVLENVECA